MEEDEPKKNTVQVSKVVQQQQEQQSWQQEWKPEAKSRKMNFSQ